MRGLTAGLLVLPVLLALAGRGAYAEPGRGTTDLDQFEAERDAAIERLIAKGTAESLAAAAALKQFGQETDNGAYPLVARAVQLAPGRRDLAWLAVRLCGSAADCDDAAPEKYLREVDPGNGVGFTGALTRAQRKNDAAAVDAALTSIGNSERFYVYFNPLVAATATELAAVQHHGPGKPAGKEMAKAAVHMIGVIAASVLPPSQSFTFSCKGMVLEQIPGRLERCKRAAEAFSRADTFIVEGLGLSLQQKLWPMDSPQGRAISAKRRVFQYRLEEYSKLSISSSKVDEIPRDVVEVFRGHEREQEAALVYFARGGVPADPPAQWTSTQLPRVP
jgi:hypothetical protein